MAKSHNSIRAWSAVRGLTSQGKQRRDKTWWAVALVLVVVGGLGYSCLFDRYAGYHQLLNAIEKGDAAAVDALLASGVDPNRFPPPNIREDDQAPINAAAGTGNTKIVGLLINKGVDLQTTDSWGGPPMDVAARNDDVPMIAYLISRGAKVNDLGAHGSSALYGAAVSGNSHALRYLLSEGANPKTDMGGNSALDASRSLGKNECARLLEIASK